MNEASTTTRLRSLLWGVTLATTLLIPLELVFSRHYQQPLMLIPFVMVGVALVALLAVWPWPTAQVLRLFQAVMGLLLLTSLLGEWFHLRGNLEVVRQVSPDPSGWPLIWMVLNGRNPALAPGLLALVGMLGLVFTYGHPVLQDSKTPIRPERVES